MVKRLSSLRIKRKRDLDNFFQENNIKWKSRYGFSSGYDIHFFTILSPTEIVGRIFKRPLKIGELYVDEEVSYATMSVFLIRYEEYLYNIMKQLTEHFPDMSPNCKIDICDRTR